MRYVRLALIITGSVCVLVPALLMSAYAEGAPGPRSWNVVALVTAIGWALLLGAGAVGVRR